LLREDESKLPSFADQPCRLGLLHRLISGPRRNLKDRPTGASKKKTELQSSSRKNQQILSRDKGAQRCKRNDCTAAQKSQTAGKTETRREKSLKVFPVMTPHATWIFPLCCGAASYQRALPVRSR
jgi:hypothetical protein